MKSSRRQALAPTCSESGQVIPVLHSTVRKVLLYRRKMESKEGVNEVGSFLLHVSDQDILSQLP